MQIVGHLRTFSQNLKIRRDDEHRLNLAGCKFSSEYTLEFTKLWVLKNE